METKSLAIKRFIKGLSKEDMAKELHNSITIYNNKELGKISFTQEEIEKITDLLDLSNDEVFEFFYTAVLQY